MRLVAACSRGSFRCLHGYTESATSEVFNGGVCVHNLVRFSDVYGGSYFCYKLHHSGDGTIHCQLSGSRVLSYYRGKRRLKFHAFILRNNRSKFFASSIVYNVISRVGGEFPSYTMALSLNRESCRDCRELFSDNTSECLLHRRATSGGRCSVLRPPRVSLRGQVRYLCGLGEVNCRANTKFVINSPFRAPRVLIESLGFVRGLDPRVYKVNPFMPRGTAGFGGRGRNSMDLILVLLSVVELLGPGVLLPTAATLNAISPLNQRGNVLRNTGIMVPGLSPIGREGSCSLCSGGVYAKSRTTRYVNYLTSGVGGVNCRVMASEKSCARGCS